MSKKLAKIITNVPVQFHEEDYKLKEWNKPELIEVFADLEFKTLGKRILVTNSMYFKQHPWLFKQTCSANRLLTDRNRKQKEKMKQLTQL